MMSNYDWGIDDMILDILNSAEPSLSYLAPDGTLHHGKSGVNGLDNYERLSTPLEEQRFSVKSDSWSAYKSTANMTKWHSNSDLALPPLERPPLSIPSSEKKEDLTEYPGPLKLTILIIGICLAVFLNSLDRTIITTVNTPQLFF